MRSFSSIIGWFRVKFRSWRLENVYIMKITVFSCSSTVCCAPLDVRATRQMSKSFPTQPLSHSVRINNAHKSDWHGHRREDEGFECNKPPKFDLENKCLTLQWDYAEKKKFNFNFFSSIPILASLSWLILHSTVVFVWTRSHFFLSFFIKWKIFFHHILRKVDSEEKL